MTKSTSTNEVDQQLKKNTAAAAVNTKQGNINTTAVLYKVSKSTSIAAKSQGFVELELVNQINTITSHNIIFEPFNFPISLPDGCIAAKSVQRNKRN